ncbi:prophage regulatory protein [Roseivivax halotolerans]|uniref:Prophage regulatory protein n=1 Tax=Roseivivax halotolerans TaxID=93684 RepID=A0A1I5XG39_9RHOB|nr:AlpA family transcriptional regulator [Roseivivax halotolerans]SFQ30931.1 prophage regulatory protein [Roseivivax halotolerans]
MQSPTYNQASPERLLKMPEVTHMTGFARSQVYAMISTGAFPRPIKLGRCSRWPESEVLSWIEDRKCERQ